MSVSPSSQEGRTFDSHAIHINICRIILTQGLSQSTCVFVHLSSYRVCNDVMLAMSDKLVLCTLSLELPPQV